MSRLPVSQDLFRLSMLVATFAVLAACRPQGAPVTPPAGAAPPSAKNTAVLAPEKQAYIWAVEHTTFELESKFGAVLLTALRSRDAAGIERLCRPGFAAHVPAEVGAVRLDRSYLQVRRTAAGKPVAATAAQFAQRLQSCVGEWAAIDKLTCRVLDLHAAENNPELGKWHGVLYLAGSGKTVQGGLVEFVSLHRVAWSFRSDEEIAAAQIVDQWDIESIEQRTGDQPLFVERTAEFGLELADLHDNWKVEPDRVRQYFSQIAVDDYNRDGRWDLAVASANGRWRLLRLESTDRFVDVTADVGLPPWADELPASRAVADQAFLATWIDIDNDSFPDLLLGDRLFRNHAGQRFEDVTAAAGLQFEFNPKGCVVADYDGDGWLDLYVLYQNTRDHDPNDAKGWVGDETSGAENQLWRNLGGGKFRDVTAETNAGGGRRQSFAAVWFHANDDRYPDLYVANDFGRNCLLLNRGQGRFADAAPSAGVADYSTSMGVAAGDLTGDGRAELYVANMFSKMGRRIIAHVQAVDYPAGVFEQIQGSCAGNRLYTPLADGLRFGEFSEQAGVNQVGWAYAPSLADFDADGWLDIYATTGFLSFTRGKPDG